MRIRVSASVSRSATRSVWRYRWSRAGDRRPRGALHLRRRACLRLGDRLAAGHGPVGAGYGADGGRRADCRHRGPVGHRRPRGLRGQRHRIARRDRAGRLHARRRLTAGGARDARPHPIRIPGPPVSAQGAAGGNRGRADLGQPDRPPRRQARARAERRNRDLPRAPRGSRLLDSAHGPVRDAPRGGPHPHPHPAAVPRHRARSARDHPRRLGAGARRPRAGADLRRLHGPGVRVPMDRLHALHDRDSGCGVALAAMLGLPEPVAALDRLVDTIVGLAIIICLLALLPETPRTSARHRVRAGTPERSARKGET